MASLSEDAVVATDTNCYRREEGYERNLIYNRWDPNDDQRLAKVEIRVDRRPELSFAKVSVWVPSTGWQIVTVIAPEDFWYRMPGYTRHATDTADRETLNLADDLMDTLVEIRI